MTTIRLDRDGDSILRRALATLEIWRAQATPLLLPYLGVVFPVLFILGACIAEFASSTIGFRAAFPMKSDGTSLASEMMSLRYPIIFTLLAGDVLINAAPNRMKALLDSIIHSIGIGAILVVLFGVGAFMFSATFLTLGDDSGNGFASHLVGFAIALASAVMFTLSFLTTHAMMNQLLAKLPIIAQGRRERARIKAGDGLVRELHARQTRIDTLAGTIAEMEQPDGCKRKAASEAGVITGLAAAEFYDLVASRKAMGDAEVGPDDHVEMPKDVPLAALEQRLADLQRYTSEYFFALLKQKEA